MLSTIVVETLTQHLSVGVGVCQIGAISNLFGQERLPLIFFSLHVCTFFV